MYQFDTTISSAVGVAEPASHSRRTSGKGPLSAELLNKMNRYWRAANYLTVGQIYLQDNPLLREPLRPEHIKPRLLGHWGTSPGLSFIYVHLNRLIQEHDANVIYLAGPGHGGPAIVANVYLEGTYSEVYPEISQDAAGLWRLFRQFSTPGGIPSHVGVSTPGSIHEGGELGYVLVHAFGAAFDNPDLIVAAVVGDGEAETGPLSGSWQGSSFLNPVRDGAVLPILHLNGYKISGPTVLGRSHDDDVRAIIEGHGYEVHFVEGDDPRRMHQEFAATLDTCYAKIRAIQQEAEGKGYSGRPRWPAIVLRTPKGWTGPKELDGLPVEGTFRAHQVPLPGVKSNPEQLAMLESWMGSYHPEELFDPSGRLVPELAELGSGERGKALIAGMVPAQTGWEDIAVAVRRYSEELLRSGADIRLLLVLHDGYPNDGPDAKKLCQSLRGKVEVIGVLLDPDEGTQRAMGEIFGHDRLVACESAQLPRKLAAMLRSIRGV